MKRVALLVTGKTEEVLHQSLKRVFPGEGVTFVMRPPREGFTSTPLLETPLRGTEDKPTAAEKLAQALVAEVDPGRRDEEPPDLVVLVDDLELYNVEWPERAIEYIRTAVSTHVDRRYSSETARQRALSRVRARCSFHLLCPMVEAYFYAEGAALDRADAKRASMFEAKLVDAESFEVADPDFLTHPDRPKKGDLPPWATPDRACHPKRYLQFLCDPTGKEKRAYKETEGGRAALRELDWPAVLAPSTHVRFIRSLIHDLADALDEPAIAAQFPGDTHPATWPPCAGNLLRNV
jgi:hypothetical protein